MIVTQSYIEAGSRIAEIYSTSVTIKLKCRSRFVKEAFKVSHFKQFVCYSPMSQIMVFESFFNFFQLFIKNIEQANFENVDQTGLYSLRFKSSLYLSFDRFFSETQSNFDVFLKFFTEL